MNTEMLCFRIWSTFSFILTFSASSISAMAATDSTRTRLPNTFTLSASIGVLAIRMRAFSTRLGWCTPGFLSSRKPSSR
uniref:Putative secreted protein n=1 Tax=Ixodes ricinus TaxID=34613 RepID=A0A6B0U3W8_IXORI